MPDQHQAVRAARDQRADLFLLDVRAIGRTGDQQRVAVGAQLFLEGLDATGEDRVLHRRDDRPDGVRALRGQNPAAEIR
jgi:hypothetical protein